MAILTFVVGRAGSGKSTSVRNCDPETTVVINSDQKALPFKSFKKDYNEEKGNYLQTSDIKQIKNFLKDIHKNKPKVKTVVIDTWSRIMTDSVMSSSFRNAPNGMQAWSNMAFENYDLLNVINEKLRDDIIVYLFCHPETVYDETGMSQEQIAVQGQQLKKFVPESFSSIVLYTQLSQEPGKGMSYGFRTVTNGNDTCKSPIGMFGKEVVDNDLTKVSATIREYYS